MKKKVILSSVLTIVLCLSLIAGSTYALFTDKDEVNVAVTAGTVDVTATADNFSYTSSLAGGVLTESTYSLVENSITVQYMVPGDTLEFDIIVSNGSNVAVDYRPLISVTNDDGLWSGLVVKFTVDGTDLSYTLTDGAWTGDYAELAPGSADITIHVSISLPEDRGNEYQNKTCTFAYTVEAVQANAQ